MITFIYEMMHFPIFSLFLFFSYHFLFPFSYFASMYMLQILIYVLCVLSLFSRFRLFATPWTVALQAPLSVGFSRQEYRSGLPGPPSGALLNSGMESESLKSPAVAGKFFTTGATWEALLSII